MCPAYIREAVLVVWEMDQPWTPACAGVTSSVGAMPSPGDAFAWTWAFTGVTHLA